MSNKTNSLDQMHVLAVSSRSHSHSPYSHHKVGAAIKLSTGQTYGGCNVENASYGGTVCAERVAIWKAVSENGTVQIDEVVVVTDQQNPWPPCGMCRQVISEFATPNTKIHLANLEGIQRSLKFTELFPESFGPAHLPT